MHIVCQRCLNVSDPNGSIRSLFGVVPLGLPYIPGGMYTEFVLLGLNIRPMPFNMYVVIQA